MIFFRKKPKKITVGPTERIGILHSLGFKIEGDGPKSLFVRRSPSGNFIGTVSWGMLNFMNDQYFLQMLSDQTKKNNL